MSFASLLGEPAFAASLLAAALSSVGVFITFFNMGWAERQSDRVTAFASGVLILVALLHLIPEGVAANPYGALFVLGGYAFMYATGELFSQQTMQPDGGRRLSVTPPLVGIAFHSFVDGLEYPILFANSIFTGVMATSGLIIHEVAEGVIVFALLRRGSVARPVAAALALLAAAATTPLGACVSLLFITAMSEQTVGALLCVAAGALLYVGAIHLPRSLSKSSRWFVFPLFVLGVLLAALTTLSHGAKTGHLH